MATLHKKGVLRSTAGRHFRAYMATSGQRDHAKWVYTWKVDEQGWVVKAKSRLVARGFKQREGIYFGETFAPTLSSSYVRLLSAIVCECDLDLCHFDVGQAFVQSRLEENVFLRLPRGCGKMSGKVVRLNKVCTG